MCCFKSLFRKQKDPNPQDLVESFKISFEKENTIDLAVDVSDLVFDRYSPSRLSSSVCTACSEPANENTYLSNVTWDLSPCNVILIFLRLPSILLLANLDFLL